jgi:phage I-like protein
MTSPHLTLLIRAATADEAIGLLAAAQPLTVPLEPGQALPTEITWMPAGQHTITAFAVGGEPWTGKVLCDEQGCRLVQAAFERLRAAGQRVPLDKDHEDKEATAWVLGFRWDPARGILAQVEWTALGEQLLRGKVYHSFSPAFLLDRKTGRVCDIPAGGHAAGGLVNAPAFGTAMPSLIAARLAATNPQPASGGTPDTQKAMNRELLVKILAALAVTHAADATEEQLVALVTKHLDRLPEAGAEGQALQAQLAELQTLKAKAAELDALKTTVSSLQAKDLERRKADAKAAVEAAVARGAIPAKDEQLQAKWRGMLETDPAKAELLAALPGNPALSRITQPGAAVQVQARDNVLVALRAMHAETDHVKRGQIYRDVRKFVAEHSAEVLPLLAANSLGTLAGDLVVQRALDLLKLNFPVLRSITTDFSAESARQGQAIKTRIVSVPSVVTLDDATGWSSSDATTTDVAVTIGQPKGVQIEYGSSELAKTARDLFGEQVEACHYALAKDLVDALYALITAGNFANATTKATASFGRADVVAMEKALASRGVEGPRTLLLNADTYERLSNDSTLVNLAVYQRPEVITGYAMPPVGGFDVVRAINLPGTGNLTGFGFRKDALVVATRLPEDYTRAFPGAAHGSVSVVTNPDTGISVQKVDFVDHRLAKALSRIAWAYGVAKGNGLSGQRLVSA